MRKLFTKYFGTKLNDLVQKENVKHFENVFISKKKESYSDNQNYKLEKLRKLLIHAYENVPFYTKRMDNCNFNPFIINSISDLEKLPPLSRSDLQTSWKDIVRSGINIDILHKGSSSGSTGEPVIYFKDKSSISSGRAALLLGWGLSGWEFGSKGLHIWGNPSTVNNEWKKTGSKLKTVVFNHYKFPAYTLVEESKIMECIELIKNKNFDFIDGYTNALYIIASFMKDNNISLKRKLNQVFTTAENLQPFQREIIELMLGPVFDGYGCGEINGIAYECKECKKYHIIDPHVVVEYGDIVSENGGRELMITDLDNYSFPLIRYKNGDLGTPLKDKSSCSVPWNRIDQIEGRVSDIINLPNGGTLSVPSFFGSMLLRKVKGIRQYQVIRISKTMLEINFVVTREYSAKDEDIINEALDDYLLGIMEYKVVYVEKIESSKNGKFKLLIDKCPS